MIRPFILWFSFLASCAFSYGQNPPPAFRIFSAAGSYNDLRYQATAKSKVTPVQISQAALSSAYPYPASANLELFREIPPPPDAPPGTKPTRLVVVSIPLPQGSTGCVIALIPKLPPPVTRFSYHVVAEDSRHRAGIMQAVNLSGFYAAVSIEGQQEKISKGEVRFVPIKSGNILVKTAVQPGSNWVLSDQSEYRVAVPLRAFMFIFNYMDDPDYGEVFMPPPALIKTFFEVSPDYTPPK